MSEDQEPTPAQSLRHLLRTLHFHFDPEAPQIMTTRRRAIALLPHLTGLAGDASPFAGLSNDSSPSAPTPEPESSRSARRRSGASRGQSGSTPRASRVAAGLAANLADSERRDASGVTLGGDGDEPEHRTLSEQIRDWWESF